MGLDVQVGEEGTRVRVGTPRARSVAHLPRRWSRSWIYTMMYQMTE